jgi:hypothetical protein
MLVVYSPFMLSMVLHHECDITVIKNDVHIDQVPKVALCGDFWLGGGVRWSAVRAEMVRCSPDIVIG